ncbi:glycoside hydrolase family 76 protein [Puia sp. P3]|uniref:glycoside hydrolase family 76 protein n=1 Tax=Puia sp. P3 TaxID=3423952 RepID=UPI003D66C8E7
MIRQSVLLLLCLTPRVNQPAPRVNQPASHMNQPTPGVNQLRVNGDVRPDYSARIQKLYHAIETRLADKKTGLYIETTDNTHNEHPHSYMWPLCAYIRAANEMEAAETNPAHPANPAQPANPAHPAKSYMAPVLTAIDQYYNDEPPAPGYGAYVTKEKKDTRYYDDNQWIAIADLDAYNRTHQQKYLDQAELIDRFMMTGLDTVSGGGFYWREGDKSSKNTCSNGPGILIALQLYKITHKQEYLNTALAVYAWTNKWLESPEGVYYDNIRTPSLKISKATYTYNTGTMLQANVLLYGITKDEKYLTEAKRVAAAGKQHFFKDGRLPGNYWFNAVFLRGYEALYRVDHNRDWIDFFVQDAEAVWNTRDTATDMVGPKPAKSLIDQAAMIEIYARLAAINL